MPSEPQIEALYDSHAESLFRFLLSLSRDESEARDLLQEVFVKVVRRPDCLEGVGTVRRFSRGWLTGCFWINSRAAPPAGAASKPGRTNANPP